MSYQAAISSCDKEIAFNISKKKFGFQKKKKISKIQSDIYTAPRKAEIENPDRVGSGTYLAGY